MLFRTPFLCTLMLLGPASLAGDHDQLMATYLANFPEKNQLAVVCEYRNSQQAVQSLADVSPGCFITVVDIRQMQDADKALSVVRNLRSDVLVLLPKDRLAGDGKFAATYLVRNLAKNNIFTVATTPRAIKQGAWFAIGPETNGQLLLNPDIRGEVTVTFPGSRASSSGMSQRSAAIQIISLGEAPAR